MQDSDDRFFRGNISSPRSNRSLSNFGKGKKKQDSANGVCNNKMSFAVQHHKRKDWNEKPQSSTRMQTLGNGTRIIEGGPTSDPMSLKKTWGRENVEEAFTISHEHPDQYVTMGTTLTTNNKQLLADVLRENKEVFAWTKSKITTVPRFIMKHQLKIYPLAKPMVRKRQPMASEGRLALKEKVFHWLKEGLIRKDMYPLLEEGEGLASLIGYPYKCFLRLLKEYNQIRMAEDDEEKTRFHTKEGVYCFTHMPKEKLRCYTLEDDGKGLSRSKRKERGNILGRNSNKKQK
ncbi:hypothetical protein Tco_1520003 [Tanacetum coccineum]